MSDPTAAMLTIGDEILSGRTQDTNMNHLARALTPKGIAFREARTVPDIAAEIVAAAVRCAAAIAMFFHLLRHGLPPMTTSMPTPSRLPSAC